MLGDVGRYLTISPLPAFGKFSGFIVVGVLYAVSRPIVIPIVSSNRVTNRVSNHVTVVILIGVGF